MKNLVLVILLAFSWMAPVDAAQFIPVNDSSSPDTLYAGDGEIRRLEVNLSNGMWRVRGVYPGGSKIILADGFALRDEAVAAADGIVVGLGGGGSGGSGSDVYLRGTPSGFSGSSVGYIPLSKVTGFTVGPTSAQATEWQYVIKVGSTDVLLFRGFTTEQEANDALDAFIATLQ